MNYQAHYDRLIDRARNRVLTGYSERHHIIPVCMGGAKKDKNNIVRLTPEEHYVAHQLLYRIHKTIPLFNAITCMTRKSKTHQSRNNRRYGWIKRQHALNTSRKFKNSKKSPETKMKIGAANAISLKGRTLTEEHRKNIGDGGRGKKRSDETRKKMSLAQSNVKRAPQSAETRKKQSIRMSLTKWWNNGVINRRAIAPPGPDFQPGRIKRAGLE